MKRREFITLLGGAAAWPLATRAQQQRRIPRVGFLGNSTAALEENLVQPFRDGLRELGYLEGHNILIEYRWAEGNYEQFPNLIAELIGLKVDVRAYGVAMCESSRARSAENPPFPLPPPGSRGRLCARRGRGGRKRAQCHRRDSDGTVPAADRLTS